MGMDIRLPVGLLFFVLGAVLTVYGAVSSPALYLRSLGYNVNLWWGLGLAIFGLVFAYFGRRAHAPPSGAPEDRP